MSGCLRGSQGTPFLIAHRGYSEKAPENTLVAFEAALASGAQVLECDVHLSSDGEVVVIHDADVRRTTNGSGSVRTLTWQQLRQLDAGYPTRFGSRYSGTRIPRLVEVLDLARGRAEVLVEIKSEAVGATADGVEQRCVAAVRGAGMADGIGVLSFSPLALRRVRARLSSLPTGLVFYWWRRFRMVAECLGVGADFLFAYAPALFRRKALVAKARRSGLRVGVYVVDQAADLRSLVAMGVDAFDTNRIGELLPALESVGDQPDLGIIDE